MDKLLQPPRKRVKNPLIQLFLLLLALTAYALIYILWPTSHLNSEIVPINAHEIIAQCIALQMTPGPPANFNMRKQSDRFVAGTRPTVIRNATIWTGRKDGEEIVHGDILIDKGLIKKVGSVNDAELKAYQHVVVLDAKGGWVSPGIVDMHSHLGVGSSPGLSGARDSNSHKGLVLPWMRSLDGLNTHDAAYRLSISGGVSTANVLPGSANAIGGQAFVIKLRPTKERSSSAMLLEPPFSVNGTHVDPFERPRWRQMKHACGENPSRVYAGTRMDTQWAFRQGYDTARTIMHAQDAFCADALAGHWGALKGHEFPENLQWEALVDVLRGRVKVHNHCYEGVDFDGMVRLTNEFKFSIAAFHHAHEAYLVPDLIKKAYGPPPAVAMFATHARYKREASRGSEFAPRILADNGLDVVMKSDHPVLNSRHLIYEAQQAHHFGLSAALALASVTSTPARIMGQDHRIGRIIEGFDADIVLWDSHPLALGAAPTQVFIDGIAQFDTPYVSPKPASAQRAPTPPTWDKEMKDAVKYDGLPPLEAESVKGKVVVLRNVGRMFLRAGRGGSVREVFRTEKTTRGSVVVVENGEIVCGAAGETCADALKRTDVLHLDLEGGTISPGMTSYGSAAGYGALGLVHISGEASTQDGPVFDPLSMKVPGLVDGTVIKAADGLLFATRDALLAYRNGVTAAIASPGSLGFLSGLSAVFSTGAPHKLANGALIQEIAALHVALSLNSLISVSTQIAAIRGLLLGTTDTPSGDVKRRFADVVAGDLPLVVAVESADIIASLLTLKSEVEAETGNPIRLVLSGATEAHLLAKEIGQAGVGVLIQQRPYPSTWEKQRILPGPPLTQASGIAALVAHNVTVGLQSSDPSEVRNTRFDVAWAELESNGVISRVQALELVSTNIERLLGVKGRNTDIVAMRGGSDLEGKVVAIISPSQGAITLL